MRDDAPTTRDTLPFIPAAAHPLAAAGLDVNKFLAGLDRFLPLAETVSRLTPSPIDDLVVSVLRQIRAGKLEVVPVRAGGR